MTTPSKEALARTVARMIRDLGPVEYLGDRRTTPRRKRVVKSLLLSEDELRAEDATEEASLREQAEDDRAEVTIRGAYRRA